MTGSGSGGRLTTSDQAMTKLMCRNDTSRAVLHENPEDNADR